MLIDLIFETKKFSRLIPKDCSISCIGILFRHFGQIYFGDREKTYILCQAAIEEAGEEMKVWGRRGRLSLRLPTSIALVPEFF